MAGGVKKKVSWSDPLEDVRSVARLGKGKSVTHFMEEMREVRQQQVWSRVDDCVGRIEGILMKNAVKHSDEPNSRPIEVCVEQNGRSSNSLQKKELVFDEKLEKKKNGRFEGFKSSLESEKEFWKRSSSLPKLDLSILALTDDEMSSDDDQLGMKHEDIPTQIQKARNVFNRTLSPHLRSSLSIYSP